MGPANVPDRAAASGQVGEDRVVDVAVQEESAALRCRVATEAMRNAAKHVRYGYRRLTVLLRREGWKVNAKRIYRLYTEEQLIVRTKLRRKLARRQRGSMAMATAPNQCWSMDFMSDKLADGRSFRILTVVHQFTRECVCLESDRAMTGMHVAQALERAKLERGKLPAGITVDNGTEFSSRVLEAWVMSNGTALFYSAGPPRGERIHRELQWAIARRMLERGVVCFAGRCAAEASKIPRALQSRAPAQCVGGPHAGGIYRAT
jgi:Integrase core domain/HTH-like domain